MFLGKGNIILLCFAAGLVLTIFQIICTVQYDNSRSSPDERFDILVNSYMRSGSSFLGRLLASRADTFYWYEPLWNYDSGVYYWGSDLICVGKAICGFAKNKTRHNIKRVLSTFDGIYRCDLRSLSAAISDEIIPYQEGVGWKSFKTCTRKNNPVSDCLGEMESACRLANHRATKTVRLTLDIAGKILENNPKVKLVHLIRDPRAIINSRLTTNWYGLNEFSYNYYRLLTDDAYDMCKRMIHDLKISVYLKQKFPDRFILVMFEDLVDNRTQKAEILSKFFGTGNGHEPNSQDFDIGDGDDDDADDGGVINEDTVQEIYSMTETSKEYVTTSEKNRLNAANVVFLNSYLKYYEKLVKF